MAVKSKSVNKKQVKKKKPVSKRPVSKILRKKVSTNKKKSSKRKDSILERMEKEEDDIEYSILQQSKNFFTKHIDNYESSYGRMIEGGLFFANICALIIFVISTYDLTSIAKKWLIISEIFLVSIFIVEYGVRMWVARNKVRHFFNIYSIIDLISILPIMVNFVNLTFFRIFRILRLFRLLRVLRFQRMFKSQHTLFGSLTDTEIIVTRIVLTVFTIIFMFAGLIWSIEDTLKPGSFGTIFDALYFAIVTLSTVGYGDITPLSSLGKFVTVIMILSGIALIPWQLGKLLKVLVQSGKKQYVTCKKCGAEEHDMDAIHCKMCGTILKHKRSSGDEDEELAMAEEMLIK